MLEKPRPGASIVDTASRAGAMRGDNLDAVKALARVGRATDPDEVADVMLFSLSPLSHWIHGRISAMIDMMALRLL